MCCAGYLFQSAVSKQRNARGASGFAMSHYSASSDENKHMLSSLLYHIGRMDLRNRLLGVQGKYLTWKLVDL